VRAEVPTWLFQKVTIQYHDAGRCSSRWRKRRRSICGSYDETDRAAVLAEFKAVARADGSLQAAATATAGRVRLREKPALMRWPMYKDGASRCRTRAVSWWRAWCRRGAEAWSLIFAPAPAARPWRSAA